MNRPMVGERKRQLRLSDDISIKELKKSAKLYKCTLTEAMQTVMSQVLKEYSEK